jgi:hypothetical protein
MRDASICSQSLAANITAAAGKPVPISKDAYLAKIDTATKKLQQGVAAIPGVCARVHTPLSATAPARLLHVNKPGFSDGSLTGGRRSWRCRHGRRHCERNGKYAKLGSPAHPKSWPRCARTFERIAPPATSRHRPRPPCVAGVSAQEKTAALGTVQAYAARVRATLDTSIQQLLSTVSGAASAKVSKALPAPKPRRLLWWA